jgi:hypothetical protein
MTQQVKNQIKAAIAISFAIIIGISIQCLYIRAKQAEDAIKGYERRSDRANHVIDSLGAVNEQRALQIEALEIEMSRNKEQYETNISAIDSLDRNGLRRAMRGLLTELAGERYPGQSND